MKLNLLLKTMAIFSLGFVLFSSPVLAAHSCPDGLRPVHADAQDKCLTDAQAAAEGIGDLDNGITIKSVLVTALNLLSFIAGVIAVIMLVIAGLKYITSQGSAEATKGAQNTIIYAIVGLAVVAVAQTIVRFVLGRL